MIMIQNVGLHFAGELLFEGVTFRINKNDRIGLAGKNGAGKSTLLKILSQEIQSTEGEVCLEGDVKLGFLRQDLEFEKGRTVWEETKQAFLELNELQQKIDSLNEELTQRTDYESDSYSEVIEKLTVATERFSHLGGYTLDAEMEKILNGLGFKKEDFHRLTDEFSGGWRMRIELAKLLLQNNDVLLLDEPTNHLDIESIIWLEQFLTTYPGAVVLVSHDKQFLTAVTNRTIEISNKSIQDYKANYTKYLILRKERKEKLLQSQKNQEQHIKQTEQLIEKFRAKASKASMAQSLIKKLDKLERIEIEDEDVTKFNIRFEPSVTPGKVIFKAENLSKSYGEKTIFSDANFYIERNEKIAFLGQNGQGKTTLAKILAGINSYDGELETGHNVQIGYFAQNQEEVLNPDKTVLQEAEDASTEQTRSRVRDLLGTFLFQGDTVTKKVKVLSGGERNRLALCKLLLRPFNVLIMDEPTNHLDIQSKEIIKQALINFKGTLILVSHDREFLNGLGEKIFEFRNGKIKEFLGNVEEYLEERQKQNLREVELEKNTKTSQKQVSKNDENNYQTDKEYKKLKQKIDTKEKEINQLEIEIADLEAEFSEEVPDNNKLKTYEDKRTLLEKTMLDWEELVLELDSL
ncbi:MAG: ABC-F family ATP-binding cassette domain-containing protein [Flavobacteriales bacterium]|nr:ABC-F family ATP-binding cassette domain-containing protein [Flavobacteriales bacterium]